jgi:hypothetical protein
MVSKSIKSLFTVIAALEGGTGLALLLTPSMLVSLLLGASLDTPGAMTVGRVAGAALLSLGGACWLARDDGQSRAARGLIVAMMFYNVVVAALLIHARFGAGLAGVGLWPAVVVHAALAVWCIACLRTSDRKGKHVLA